MHRVKIRKVDGSLMLPLGPEVLGTVDFEVREEDSFYLESTGNGEFRIKIPDPETQRLIAAEDSVIEKNHEILAGLA